jgi:hypothetical protein
VVRPPDADVGVVPTVCPWCGRRNDLHAGMPGTRPKPGDVGICWRCAGPAVFLDDLTMRRATDAEMEEMATDPQVVEAVRAMQMSDTPQEAVRRWIGNMQ